MKRILAFALLNVFCGCVLAQNIKDTLYNGIVISKVWPPKTQSVKSSTPMEVPYLKHIPEVIPINKGRQLFVDDFLIAQTNLIREFHQAEKYEGNPVFRPTTAEEFAVKDENAAVTYLGHGGVFYNPQKSMFEMFYTGGWRGGLSLALSKDLMNWERPNLGINKGNVVLPSGAMMAGGDNSIWLDLDTKDTSQRYKAIIERGVDGAWQQYFDKKTDGPTHTIHFSADGRLWSQGITTGRAADYTSIFYNPFRSVWVYSIKQNTDRGRARAYAESKDFMRGAEWKNRVFWVNADKLDQPDPEIKDSTQLYSLNAVAYESLMLGQFYIHLGPHNKVAEEGKYPKVTEIKMGFSRDGFHWDRPDRSTFIAASRKEGTWDRGYVHGTTGIVLVKGDKLWFPYTGFSGIAPDGHKGMYTGASIGLATLRRDGFASMNASKKEGTLTTRKVSFDGEYLFVNVDSKQGELKVEVLDETGKVLAGFSKKDCVGVKTDKTIHQITWKNGGKLASLKNKQVKFRFYLTNGKLYSFWVSPNENGASLGYVGAGGPGYEGTIDDKGILAYQ
ncbi:MAG: hypothetical protein REI64_14770 [Pedobacter sp.]|uniref:hypothetical protein n=1 Tax=Pedobacter sp. TaxID=1411316 RepID=UPI00280666DA|nr:hypothetical protein [Pedobacter sp.]MDQ8006063.1 hypothetical protein [Pedobacter sp.]